ncbi:conserved hypothetical protein [Candidatus Desulfosporosinus infrequens]|uniref:Uncharacterized protein n=1 Tax=Candidatus Desulfosporosinus infrequens TaxID=2043169 RepID=A0A2U3LP80_9FIRM|nr:conserved hypothetical protein [Candidatus Desulfosporosinus infrequens]
MNKEQISNICDSLIDQLTILKGFIQLNKMNNKIDHSIIVFQEVEILEKMIRELAEQLLTLD